ncbi:MAG: lysophospholipid acyltransferase family protein [Gammaproteobacteria bacterium]
MRRLLELGYGIYAALILLACTVATLPFVLLMPTLSLRRACGRLGFRAVLLLCFVPLRVRGLEHLPPGPCLVISNHASYLDGPLMTAVLPGRFTFVVQHGAADWPLVGRIIRGMGVTFVNRGAARAGASQTRGLIRRLQNGESLTVFAEGTFKEDAPGLLPFRDGAFMMAVHAGVPVVPAVGRGSRRVFGGARPWPRWGALHVEFFAPLAPSGDHRHAVDALRDAARAVVLAHCGERDRGDG